MSIWYSSSNYTALRPIDSLILPKGVKESIVRDAKDFLRSEGWYRQAGIQHKRGYLLYGPPGTGKTSTIHALVRILTFCSLPLILLFLLQAGELNLEIYSLSLATNGYVLSADTP
jgi:mitochondrial chaperone BCS1